MYPHVDKVTCTECKQCEIACPTLPFLHTAPYDSVRKKSTSPKVAPNQTLHFIALENAKIALGGGALSTKQKPQSPSFTNTNLSKPNLSDIIHTTAGEKRVSALDSALQNQAPTQDSSTEFIPQAYAIKANDEALRLKSSSGGVFSLLARAVLEQGGVVFGAGYTKPDSESSASHCEDSQNLKQSAKNLKETNSVAESAESKNLKNAEHAREAEQSGIYFHAGDTTNGIGAESKRDLLTRDDTTNGVANLEVRHSFIESLQELDNFRRSKYVESPIGDCFIKAKEFLRAGRLVLFSGVQCQIHGLNAFLRKKYPNLLTIEVICNSVPSPKIWRIYKESMLEGEDSKLLDFNFRGKDYGWERGIFAAKTKTKTKTKTIPHTLSPYYTGFLGHTTTRPSCENCFSKDMRSGADITIGDFWGVRNFHPEFVDDKGISCVIFNNANAHKWLDSITPFAKVEKSSIHAVLSGNPALIKSGFINKNAKRFSPKF